MKQVLMACAMLALAACATTPPTETKSTDVAETQVRERNDCLRETGTRIKRKEGDGCTRQNGRVYTEEDIRESGAQNVNELLRYGGR